MVAITAAVVKKGDKMNRITTGIFNPKGERPLFSTTMFCLDCELMWEAQNVSFPCPRCESKEILAAARWAPARYGMPKLSTKGV